MSRSADPTYAEFAVQSNFSFLRGASTPEELVAAASLQDHAAMGLADRNTVAGVVRAWSRSKEAWRASGEAFAFHPGCRLVFSDGAPDILAYPRDREGWGRLCRMLTVANMRGDKGAPDLRFDDFLAWGDGMSLAVLPSSSDDVETLPALLSRLRSRFGEAIRLAAAARYAGDDRFRLDQAAAIAQRAGVPLMAVNDVLYHAAERRPLQDVLSAIRLKTTVTQAGHALEANAERHLKPPAEMARIFRDHPQALAETLRFAGELGFSLKELSHNYPEETSTAGVDPQTELEQLTWQGARHRYPRGIPPRIAGLVEHELEIVAQKNYARYFLTVHDIVRFARSEQVGILCQGRGSAANSVICFCLGITEVDPNLMDVLFERFISTERDEPPDIDVDFEHERRDEIIAYIYRKYSEKRTALAASVVTYRSRSALREVSRAMGLSNDVQDALAGAVWGWSSDVGPREAAAAGLQTSDPMVRLVLERAGEIAGFPRHLSQHVGGFVITRDRLDEIVPIVKTGMEERKMVEWDKDDLDAVGILKVDVLALGMLSCLRRCFALLESHYPERDEGGRPLTLATLPKEQEAVYDMICRADTLGVFQIESRAQMSMLPRLKPRKFYDLVIEVAIVRPGPIQGDMVHPYLRRREGKEPVSYPSPALKNILERTLGVPLFQEQAMKIAIDAGGYSPGEADQLRRAMATFRRNGTIGRHRDRLIEGMVANGYDRDFAARCFQQIEGFGEYGFPESHAAAFALLVYASCWFKAFYPDVFCAAILNAQPMGFYAPAQLVRDARDHGVAIHPVDVGLSQWDCTLEETGFDPGRIAPRHASMAGVIRATRGVRLGFRQVKGVSERDMRQLVAARGAGYVSVRDLWLRSGLRADVLEKLAAADAFRSMGLDRREALWAVKALDRKGAAERLPLFDRPGKSLRDLEPATLLPTMPPSEHVIHDYRALGLSLKAHPASFLRARMTQAGMRRWDTLADIASGRRVAVAGLVLVRQRPGSANGVIFMTVEDETGIANIIVWPKIFERFRPVVLGARLVGVTGRLQSHAGVIHLVADRIEDLTAWLADLSEEAVLFDSLARADEVKHPTVDHRGAGRPGDGPAISEDAAESLRRAQASAKAAGKAMPGGRNFH